jgi:hypothetical protein
VRHGGPAGGLDRSPSIAEPNECRLPRAFSCHLLANGRCDFLGQLPDWCFVVPDQDECADPVFECEPSKFVDGLRSGVQESADVDWVVARWFAWSPDGRTIAFLREREVYIVRADGSGERRLTQLNE